MDQRLVELAELQARLGGPGWLRRLSIDVFEDPACPPGRLIYLPEQARLIVRVRWELEWQLHLLDPNPEGASR